MIKKLHLGCGKRNLKGYIHIDYSSYKHIDYVKPIYPLPFIMDNSVEEIYCSHALEYYDFQEAKLVLCEWKRCLCTNGTIRLSVPDFDQLLKVYKLNNFDINSILGPLYGKWNTLDDKFIYHKIVYTKKKLESLLISVGFKSIYQWDPLEFFGRDLESFDDYSKAYFPHMDFENGIPISINLIAKKV